MQHAYTVYGTSLAKPFILFLIKIWQVNSAAREGSENICYISNHYLRVEIGKQMYGSNEERHCQFAKKKLNKQR